MAEVCLTEVCKSFDTVDAVQNLDLTIADGEFVVLLGPTGAGKTTTLRLVAGLESPDSGQIYVAGRDVTKLDPSQRDVAFVFQQYSLYPHLTVFENMAFPLRAPCRRLSKSEILERVGEVAEMLHISHKLESKATELSGGEMQRVSIGRALVRAPNIFLMDEPLSSLDAKLREDLRVELKHIQQDLGATVLYVTHDQLEAMTLADRVGVLDEGRLVQVSTPVEVYERPSSIYAARRLGSPPINLLPVGTIGLQPKSSSAKTIGVRPEDILIGRDGVGAKAKVMTVENLGAETVVLLGADGLHLHSLVTGAETPNEGDSVFLTVNANKALEFGADGMRL